MYGEKLSNQPQLPKRPKGANESDMKELNDWTITDIATTSSTNEADRKNAEAEIARREADGTYNPDSASHDIRNDFFEHGYGLDHGEIAYPTKEYSEWLASDRRTPMPKGVIRETLKDRIKSAEKAEAREQKLLGNLGASARKVILDEEFAPKEHFRAERDIIPKSLTANEKHKEEAKKQHKENWEASKAFASPMPQPVEFEESADSSSEAPFYEVPHDEKTAESFEAMSKRSEKLFNRYKADFAQKYPSWLEYGVVKNLEKGKLETDMSPLLRAGFISKEEPKIESAIDQEQTQSGDAIWVEGELKRRVLSEVIEPGAEIVHKEQAKEAEKKEDGIVTTSLQRGIVYAISTGSYIDSRTGDIVYSLPTEKGQGLTDYIEKATGFNLGEYKENDRVRQSAFQGIANIIDNVKDDVPLSKDAPSKTKTAFEVIDWYFDTFKFKEHVPDFLDNMDAYDEPSDSAWKTKYEEYLDHRKEIGEYLNQNQSNIPTLIEKRETDLETLQSIVDGLNGSQNSAQKQLAIMQLFAGADLFPRRNNLGIQTPKNPREPIPSIEKIGKAAAEFRDRIKNIDPNASAYICTMMNSRRKKVLYLVFQYDQNNSHIAQAVPVAAASNEAAYVWVGYKGAYSATDWTEVFVEDSSTGIPASKYRARKNENVKAFNHISAMKTKGLDAIDNIWDNMINHIDKAS